MATYDLCSAVFVLKPENLFAPGQFMGRAAHKLFLHMLNESGYPDLTTELHNQDAALPFTVSDLFHNDDRQTCWMRITGLDARMTEAIHCMVERLPRRATVDGWSVEFGLLEQHAWTAQATYADFLAQCWRGPETMRITLDFMTPTLLRNVGIERPFPDAALVFRLLYERLLRIPALAPPFQPAVEHLEAFAQYYVSIIDYQLRCSSIEMKQHPVTTFYGWVTYRLMRDNEAFEKRARTRRDKQNDISLMIIWEEIERNHGLYIRLMNLLASFAFYSGVGAHTSQGLGMTRCLAKHGR
jgi:hypothetical protein